MTKAPKRPLCLHPAKLDDGSPYERPRLPKTRKVIRGKNVLRKVRPPRGKDFNRCFPPGPLNGHIRRDEAEYMFDHRAGSHQPRKVSSCVVGAHLTLLEIIRDDRETLADRPEETFGAPLPGVDDMLRARALAHGELMFSGAEEADVRSAWFETTDVKDLKAQIARARAQMQEFIESYWSLYGGVWDYRQPTFHKDGRTAIPGHWRERKPRQGDLVEWIEEHRDDLDVPIMESRCSFGVDHEDLDRWDGDGRYAQRPDSDYDIMGVGEVWRPRSQVEKGDPLGSFFTHDGVEMWQVHWRHAVTESFWINPADKHENKDPGLLGGQTWDQYESILC